MFFCAGCMRWYEFCYVFVLGFFFCIFISMISFSDSLEFPIGSFKDNGTHAPQNFLSEDDIIVREDMVIVMIDGASISRYAASGSMEPTFGSQANGIRIVPVSEADIDVGDIVTFEREGHLIVHRVVQKSKDIEGIYFVTKGDNNDFYDGKIRFSDIRYKTIGVLY